MNQLKERYQKEIVPSLMKSLELDNVMQVPPSAESCCQYRYGRSQR